MHQPVDELGLEWWPIPQFGYQNLYSKIIFIHVQLRVEPRSPYRTLSGHIPIFLLLCSVSSVFLFCYSIEEARLNIPFFVLCPSLDYAYVWDKGTEGQRYREVMSFFLAPWDYNPLIRRESFLSLRSNCWCLPDHLAKVMTVRFLHRFFFSRFNCFLICLS